MNFARLLEKRLYAEGVRSLGDRPSRREVLSPAAVLAAMWSATDQSKAESRSLDPVRWLVNHITLGLTEAELNLANSFPAASRYSDYLEHHLDYLNIDDSALDTRINSTNYPTLFMTADQLASQSVPAGQVISELTEATILRSDLSNRQLYQRMVEFWTDHFNIDIANGIDNKLKTVDDRDVIRANALGTFPALLTASAQSPAMMFYLDNAASTAGNPNENYARELMELHTLSVNGGYTQTDVHEVARCLTGWTLYGSNQGTNSWHFRYLSGNHDNGSKTVLGNVIAPGGGQNDGFTVLSILYNHPSTANFIAAKLCKWLLGYTPSQSLIDSVAATYMNPPAPATRGDIKSMIRTILNSAEAMAGTSLKYKRPYHQMMSALRATGATITTTSAIRSQHLLAAGQVPFTWSPPDGFPDTLDFWVGLILPRWNFGASLLNGNISGATVNIDTFLQGANTPSAIMDRIEIALFGAIGAMNPGERSLIQNYLPNSPSTTQKRDAVGLAVGSPSFQWY